MFKDYKEMSNQELSQVIEDFWKCNDTSCSNCQASGVLCDVYDPSKARKDFSLEIAKRLKNI